MQVARGLQSAWRRRELAGDQRAGAWARRRSREAHLRVLRRTWKLLLAIGLGSAALSGLCVWAIPNALVRSYTAGFLTAAILGTLAHQVTLMAGTSGAAMGEIAEQWTAQELRKLRQRGWRVVNHLMLRRWDIDHVLVGPGGVFAVETKWSGLPWELDPDDPRIAAAVRQAKDNARDLSLWHPMKSAGAGPARGVVVLWGGRADADAARPALLRSDDVVVLTGRALDDWRASLPSDRLTPSQVESCWRALESQARLRDTREGAPPDTAWTIAVRYLTAFAAGVLSIVLIADLLNWAHNYGWWPAVYAVTIAVGVAGLRVRVLRPYAVGWLIGVATTVVTAAVTIVSRVT